MEKPVKRQTRDWSKEPQKIKELAERLRKVSAAEVYDVLDRLYGLSNQCLDLGIKPLERTMKVAGPAFTLGGGPEPRRDDEFDETDYVKHSHFKEVYEGCVIVVAAAQERCAGHSGELNSTASQVRGAKGIVIDGGIRDGIGLLGMKEWPVFARYTSPIEAKGRYRNRWHQKPIAVTGTLTTQVRINPGDWIFGDMDGVMVIPSEIVEEVVEKVEGLNAVEEKIREDLLQGADVVRVVDKFGSL